MADSKISALTAATSIAATDMVPLATAAGATKKITGTNLRSTIVPSQSFASSFTGATTGGDIAAETFPRWAIQGASVATAATAFGMRIALVPGAYTTATVGISVQGVTLANTYFGLYDSSLNRLAVSADISTPLAAATANSTYSATLSYTVTTAGDYVIAILVGSASTNPQFFRAQAQTNSGYGSLAPAIAWRTSSAALTALPDPFGALNTGATAPSFWIRYS